MNKEKLAWGADVQKWWITQIPRSRRTATPARTYVYAPAEMDRDPVQFPTLQKAIEAFSRGVM